MKGRSRQLGTPFSSGGGGGHFEAHVQASFVVLMLAGGFAPCMPCWPITKIKLQGRFAGYETDDLIIFIENAGSNEKRKILCQIKHSISITEKDPDFGEVIQAAWNDFNNVNLFLKGRDALALITGPLSIADKDVHTIIEWAKHSENAEELIKKVEMTHFSSKTKQKKLRAFRTNLQNANGGKPIPDDTLFEFLKHFNLLTYDLDVRSGVILSLLHSLIGQYSQENASSLWARIVDEVQSANKNAGTISRERLPDDLEIAFRRPVHALVPHELSVSQVPSTKLDWSQLSYVSDLVVADLLGSWNERNEADRDVVREIAKNDYDSWILKIREILQQSASPVALKETKWRVADRSGLWKALGPRLFDDILDSFKRCAVTVLSERDPKFELPSEERYAASTYGKVLKHSPELRKGLAETLALLGNNPSALTNCSLHKPKNIAIAVLREIFDTQEWLLWGSLNNLLPTLAEAAPSEFLNLVESALRQTPCPFDKLFSQESSGITGENYITGLLWALEALAWDEEFLVRVCVILGELATHDPGGNWGNRPTDSLTRILLPWLPQTTASLGKRKVALLTLQKEVPSVAWKVLINLLPNQRRSSSGTHKPSWRHTIPDDWKKGVTHEAYWEQVDSYAELAVSIATHDIEKLNELIGYLGKLPHSSLDKVLEHLSSEAILRTSEEERASLWDSLIRFMARHRRFADTKWVLNSERMSKIEGIAAKLSPASPLILHRRLFSHRDFDLYENIRGLEEHRQKAMREILGYGGMDAIIQFAQDVESPWRVGNSVGTIEEPGIDESILPAMLETQDRKLSQFASGYVWRRHQMRGWAWVDGFNRSDWSLSQVGQFLGWLPFARETWDRVTAWLGKSEGEYYWAKVSADPNQCDRDLGIAIGKLIEYRRPHAAIDCLNRLLYEKQPIDKSQSVKALLAAVSSPEPSYMADAYAIVEVIKALQDDAETDPEDLFRVEWAYLPLLDQYSGSSPKLLENRLSSDAAFFCEVIRLIYRSKKEDKLRKEPTEREKAIATNAWTLLQEWRTPPGLQRNGSFLKEQFGKWLKHAKKACTESGHLEVALTHIGQVLIYCPPDPKGLWIDRIVADALNEMDAEEMRNGFRLGLFNSRGGHTVDPTGKPERELAAKYRQKAEEVENAGYQRFAATLKGLAEDYDRDADRVVAEYKHEDELD